MKYIYRPILLLFLLTCCFNSSYAQERHYKRSVSDSLRASVVKRDSLIRSLKKSDTSLNSLLQKVEYYSNSFNQISVSIKQGFDTVQISRQLPRYEKRIGDIKVLVDKDKSNTLRYLYAIRDILTHVEDQLDDWQDQLAKYNSKLVQMRNDLSEIKRDTVFKVVPIDTSLQRSTDAPIKAILSKHRKLDSLSKSALLKVGLLQNRVADIYISILDEKDQINAKIRDFSVRAFSDEYDYIWAMKNTPGITFFSAFEDTFNMNYKLLKYMLSRDTLIHLVGLIILVSFFTWIFSNRRKIFSKRDNPKQILDQTGYVARQPFLCAVIVAFIIQPYFYDHPPAVFLECVLLVSVIAVFFLVRRTSPQPMRLFLQHLLWITVLFGISNLFVEVSTTDRLIIFVLSLASVFIAYRFLKTITDAEEYPPYTQSVLKIYIALQAIAALCNITGRFTLAKIIAVTTTFNLWLGLSLFLFVQILMQSLFLQLEANKGESVISSYLDFKVLQRRFRNALNTIAAILWIIMLAQNLSVEDALYDSIGSFLTKSRKLGGTLFTFGSIIIFIAVIWLASLVARVISYFYDSADQRRESQGKNKKAKTSMLLVRLAIFAVGFLLAVAASGVPLDKITIIISAFGVGIGFGLQNIVNNLVSGLIMAFEKPVQVGDIIEVANKSGTIKEIGIRSSKILTGDGAEVIIPNGDFISQPVINWTLSNTNRRAELAIGVAYGTDIANVKNLLLAMLKNREDIMSIPEPVVFLNSMSESNLDFRISFWAADINTWTQLKSNILSAIYELFAKNDIKLSVPQRNIHLHTDGLDEALKRDGNLTGDIVDTTTSLPIKNPED
ncbi:mechanosensitive ion channel family protein [Mucilaginibacter ginkgonis]|uniref:Mechanosensitive ion channel n=1 Tax=Mucilaginibacter ginkgonis TaxID=2682091 RepID=A0A6I4I0V0_9SPHI|nr:mechanosensitive ion channel domain-containing protein [Mucilaginibacter ginkgonis]QQL51115.1 mechanosensitive ion channel [Mucilaginibacter ginkgonis]